MAFNVQLNPQSLFNINFEAASEFILVNDDWKPLVDTFICIDNEWKKVNFKFVLVDGVWKSV
jgi:hypothetical protein